MEKIKLLEGNLECLHSIGVCQYFLWDAKTTKINRIRKKKMAIWTSSQSNFFNHQKRLQTKRNVCMCPEIIKKIKTPTDQQ